MNLLKIKNLCKNFGGFKAVDDISFDIQQSSITALIGPNGAGKTTTFNLIASTFPPSSGDILFEDKSIIHLPSYQLYHLGIVRTFQIPHEFAKLTTTENLLVSAPHQPGEEILINCFAPSRVKSRELEITQKATDVLEFLGMTKVANELAGNLSGGQKKLLEIGRTMMSDPKIVLLDEPGAGVNPTLKKEIGDMILRLNSELNYTFCIIEHDMDLVARLCESVIVMANGRILLQDTMDKIRNNEQVIDAYFGGELV